MHYSTLDPEVLVRFRQGMVIPAMPLALNEHRDFSESNQQALVRYYIDAGAGGIAVGVHTTQFEIHDARHGLYEKVLSFVSEAVDQWTARRNMKVMKIAGVCGTSRQALDEARFARSRGYHACLLSLSALRGCTQGELLDHCQQVASVMPVVGFYLQPAVGGVVLSRAFWQEFARIDNVIGIKIAPFNRYQTLDVIKGVCDAGKENEITLYTGNDDNIIVDLITEYHVSTAGGEKRVRIKGGLLGHWAVWTRRAVEMLAKIHAGVEGGVIPSELLTLAAQVTDCNAAFFDAANNYAGCIPGIHEMLRRQGLFQGTWCLNPNEILSPGQLEEIDRVCEFYHHLDDDEFIRDNIAEWFIP